MPGGFYLRGWFVQPFNNPSQSEWLLPLDGDNQHLKDTSNVEELNVLPGDMDELPQDIQAGIDQWITFAPGSVTFSLDSVPGLGGFYQSGYAADSGFYGVGAVPGLGGFYQPGYAADSGFYGIGPIPGLGGFYLPGYAADSGFYMLEVFGLGGFYLQSPGNVGFYLIPIGP